MPLPVNKTKLRGERSKLFFNFADILDFGETLNTWNVTATPIVGIDTQPNEMVFLLQETTPTTAIQYVVVGEPGVIYEFRCEALTSLGRTLVKEQTLAVLPSVSLFPPLLGTPLTTPPYPVEIGPDELLSSAAFIDGTLKVLFVIYDMQVEAIESSAFFVSGLLREPLIQYSMQPEAVDNFSIFSSGILRSILIEYSMQVEAIDNVSIFTNGTLKVILVSNSMLPEAIDNVSVFTGGTLS